MIMDLSDFPKSVVERQLTKLQKHLLINYEEAGEDGTYGGEVRSEVMEIVQKNTPVGEILDEETFSKVIMNIISELTEWINETLEGIDNQILQVFVVDFVQQVIQTTFTVSPSDPPFDPSYV